MSRHNVFLTIASLSILFVTFRLADDIVRGFEPGGFTNFRGVLTVPVWLYGTLVLADRRDSSSSSSGRSSGQSSHSPT